VPGSVSGRIEENGQSEASLPVHENVGFMGYNALAGGVLTGKYLEAAAGGGEPRGRMEGGWGTTLYRYQSGPAERARASTRSSPPRR
jgi:aryl-alcohol dehydrogenase-like predicted oxidoreductase